MNITPVVAKLGGEIMDMWVILMEKKEVEESTKPSYNEALNIHGQTPRMVITKAVKDLLAVGQLAADQQWMKNTSSSCLHTIGRRKVFSIDAT
ncbi:hypothetical protein HanXRQr2_Chr00c025g0833041 [Helianthus annuus]|uniref:Uncharacterized protein n=1 Tax=Helianthus annuus TaxID=4232 RepID=A0A251UZY9_HELAN|nr:hypothetical protein HanXRQr2_Chr00c025g0833041 [Helianthus annuus]KAJ0932073.1 hypothetical protein HanPSC8_Chr04g0169421 [Helianthus annuus]